MTFLFCGEYETNELISSPFNNEVNDSGNVRHDRLPPILNPVLAVHDVT